jgi:hypothetical protein
VASHAGNWPCLAFPFAGIMGAIWCKPAKGNWSKSAMHNGKAQLGGLVQGGLEMPAPAQIEGSQGPLRGIVRDALLAILKDDSASAAAKASAGRTLMQFFADDSQTLSTRRGADMTAAELDAAIASHPSRIPE